MSTFGDVSVHATDYSGHETILNYLSVGEPFVFRAFGTENRRRMRLTAMCPVKVLRFEYDDINRCLKNFDEFRKRFRSAYDKLCVGNTIDLITMYKKKLLAFWSLSV